MTEIEIEPPLSGIIIGNSGSGKTYLTRHLLQRGGSFRRKFDEIFVFAPTAEYSGDYDFLEKRAKRLFTQYDEDILREIVAEQKYIIKKYGRARTPQVLVLLDDCLEHIQGNYNLVNELFFKGRHWNISCICLVQRMRGLGTIMRLNARFLIFFRAANSTELEHVLGEYVGRRERGVIERELIEWFKRPWSFLVADLKTQDFSKRYGLGIDCKLNRYIAWT